MTPEHDWRPVPELGTFVQRCGAPGCVWWRVDCARGEGYVLDPLDGRETLKHGVPECGPLRVHADTEPTTARRASA